MSKTCGECRFYFEQAEFCRKNDWPCIEEDNECCDEFEKPTNGDKIRHGGNRALAEIFDDIYNGNKCKYCINFVAGMCKFEDRHAEYDEGGWVDDEDCNDGIESWLNAPAESEGKDE